MKGYCGDKRIHPSLICAAVGKDNRVGSGRDRRSSEGDEEMGE